MTPVRRRQAAACSSQLSHGHFVSPNKSHGLAAWNCDRDVVRLCGHSVQVKHKEVDFVLARPSPV